MPPVAFITGCSNGGIGSAFCKSLLSKGYLVYATARLVDSMSDLNHKNIRKLAVNVTDDESVALGIKTLYEETEGIHLLISNAGTNHTVLETNFFGFVCLVKDVVPRIGTCGKGTVVAIGSILGELATPFQAFYNASKVALHSYTETLRMECQVIGVKVVLITPGSIKSNISMWCIHSLYQSQTKAYGVMDTDEFANTVVSKITSANPPQYLTLGGVVGTWNLLK
ncbi:NAD-binding protein [Mycena vulgaris]|nr:NAD-binding protein [Mycena vulgaris]